MKTALFACAAFAAALAPAVALADNPNDPAMRNAEARAQDRVATRLLNLNALAAVRERDARGMQGWRTDPARSQEYSRAMADYSHDRAQYDREMAAWRRSVADCRAGDYSACDR